MFGSDDLCSESFTRIMEATSLGSVSSAAQDICVIQQCRERIISFVQYLSVCDGLDDNDVRILCQAYTYICICTTGSGKALQVAYILNANNCKSWWWHQFFLILLCQQKFCRISDKKQHKTSSYIARSNFVPSMEGFCRACTSHS